MAPASIALHLPVLNSSRSVWATGALRIRVANGNRFSYALASPWILRCAQNDEGLVGESSLEM